MECVWVTRPHVLHELAIHPEHDKHVNFLGFQTPTKKGKSNMMRQIIRDHRGWRLVQELFRDAKEDNKMVDDTLCSAEQFDATLRKVDTEKCKLRDDSVASGILTARP
jgi:hypothetical protein